jgi:phosphoribosylamine---glycine ligase
MKQKVLIIGAGGREHALGWAIRQSPDAGKIWFAPGNGGTALIPDSQNVPVSSDDIAGILQFCLENKPDLIVVGPEDPLAAGLADKLRAENFLVFGPSAEGAKIEASKAWAKEFMFRHRIPTASRVVFSELNQALKYLADAKPPYVIKADGLAAGKGVLVTSDLTAGQSFIKEVMETRIFGESGAQILIEEFMSGLEVSQLALCDTRSGTIIPLEPACDYKRAFDADKGANTGGMGAYSPTKLMTPAMRHQVYDRILYPALQGFITDGIDYRGLLYAGLMLTNEGVKVVEFNCRFGDPETQSLLPRLKSDLLELLTLTAKGELNNATALEWDARASVGVVLAAKGYPATTEKGKPVHGLENFSPDDPDFQLFHAGTSLDELNRIVTNRGRVFNLIAMHDNIALARQAVYNKLQDANFGFDGMWYRTDIAKREE